MKMKMKSLCMALLMMLCVVSMTACSAKEDVADSAVDAATVSSLEQQEVLYLQAFAALTDEQIESLSTSDDAFTVSAMNAWTDNRDEIGQFVEINSSEVEENEEGLMVITSDAKFENRDVIVTMNFDMTTGYPTYMTMEVQYSFKELISQAGMNTIMGVGTVFGVLLFLTLLISSFSFIGKVVDGKNKKSAPKAAAPAPAAAAPVAEENLVDDGELVAVIAAAIAASENTSTDSFVVRSIRRKNSNKWSRA